uniref:Uncharacterized protein n=1 Tax=Arundo donax TaxID=35708 RepID=A0A0A8XYS6_ARUDO
MPGEPAAPELNQEPHARILQ